MSRAAEDKKTFAQIMAEIGDSDEDDTPPPSSSRGTTGPAKPAKPPPVSMTQQQAKSSSSSSSSSSSNMRPAAASQQPFQKTMHFDRDHLDTYEPAPPKTSSTGSSTTGYQGSLSYKMSKDEQEIENFGIPQRSSNAQTAPIATTTSASQKASNLASSLLRGPSLRFTSSSNLVSSNSNSNNNSADGDKEREINPEHIATAKRWLTRTCTRGEPPMQCYIERDRSGFGLVHQIYRCYMEPTEGQGPRFLMAAKKRSSSKTSYYLISLDAEPDDRGSETVLGKLRGNAVGSQYLITDAGMAPEKAVAPSMLRKEYGVVGFEFDSGGPSQIGAYIPHVSSSGIPTTWQPSEESMGMEARVATKQFDRMLPLANKKPRWDDAHGGHVLNFQGRVTESSVKNFQMVVSDSAFNDDVVLQFGRVGKNKFSMDLTYPLNPFQAFAICVACLDNKLADRKGYEFIKKMVGRDEDEDAAADSDAAAAGGASRQMSGSASGSKSMSGMIMESLPSRQYLRDKMSRTFK